MCLKETFLLLWHLNKSYGASLTGQWVWIDTKPEDLSVISRTHVVEGENQLSQLSSDCHTCAMYVCVHAHGYIK